jgi:glycosyltransferase involved in cell wall biosynthesis
MKVLFILPYPIEIASTRQRVFQFFPYLEEHGVQCVPSCFISSDLYKILYLQGRFLQKTRHTMNGVVTRLKDLGRVSDFDLVFIHREAFPFFTTVVERRLSKKVPLIYDFDDSIYLMNPTKPSLLPLLRNPSKVETILRLADCVIAGNKHLAQFSAEYNNNVRIIPTCINTEYYIPARGKAPDNKRLVVGWIGSRSTVPYLLNIRQSLLTLSKKYDYKLKVVSNEDIDMGFPKEFERWQLGKELEELRNFDIGIMPLPDNQWTQGKCGYKIIQYMSVGKPVVASPVGVNKEIVVDGYNGYLADSLEDWENKLGELIEKKQLRDTFGKRGRAAVEEKYSLRVNAPKLLAVLKACAKTKR